MLKGQTRFYKIPEQGVRFCYPGFEFWMRLGGNKPGVISNFDHLNQLIIRGCPRDYHSCSFELITIFIINLKTMSMTLGDGPFAIGSV